MASELGYTFLFTDIEASTRLWSRAPVAMAAAVQRQETLLREIVAGRGGDVFKTVGDGIYAVFPDPAEAVRSAVEAQRALQAEPWRGFDSGEGLAVRIAVHAGTAEAREGDYYGPPLNRLSRTLDAAHGGQILCTDDTLAACGANWPAGIDVRDLGERTLRDVPGSGRIFQLIAEGLPEHFPPLSTLDPRVHNLPRWPSSLIGREDDAARLRAILRAHDTRLVTVLGTGGVGKTRLATEVAAQLLDEFQDGIRFVDLSALRDDAQVVPAIVQVTGATDQLLTPREALLEWLHDRNLLLLLDNCEQVVDGVAAIASDIVSDAPDVLILATSRTPIHIRGERQLALEPLPLPSETAAPAENPAVRLFAARANEVNAAFILDDETRIGVAEICRIVDGLPLAIELAAAWVRILSPAALQRRLQESRAMLRDGARDLPDRQRTLAATIAWSYALLEPDDQRAFRRLAVFRGGIAVDAAAAVIWSDPVDDPLWALTRLDALVQANLLQVASDSTGEPRFVMLQTIQEFAIDVLWQSGERDAAASAHAEFFTRLAAEAQTHYRTEDSPRWLDRLDLEFENLRAAIEFDAALPESQEAGLRLVVALAGYLNQRSSGRQFRAWLELTYQDDAKYPTELHVDALVHMGNTWFSDPTVAGQFYRKAIEIADESGDVRLRTRPVATLSTVAALGGDYETALSMAQDVLANGEWESSSRTLVLGFSKLAYASCEAGLFEQALAACERMRAYSRGIGDAVSEAWGWLIEGRTHRRLQHPEAAIAAIDLAVARFSEIGDQEAIGLCHLEQGLAKIETNVTSARPLLDAAATALADCSDAYTIIALIEGGARLLIHERVPEIAVELIGAAERLRSYSGIVASASDSQAIQGVIDRATDMLGKTAFDVALERGRSLTPRAALDRYQLVAS